MPEGEITKAELTEALLSEPRRVGNGAGRRVRRRKQAGVVVVSRTIDRQPRSQSDPHANDAPRP